jgi:hypothetical protein
VHGPIIPAFPTVRITDLLSETADLVQEQSWLTVGGVDGFAFAVAVYLRQDSVRTVFLLDPLDFAGDDPGGFVPGDTLVLALAPVLGIPFAIGVPIHPFEGIFYAVVRIGSLLISEGEGRGGGFKGRLQDFTPYFELPGIKLLAAVFPVIMQRPDPDYLTVTVVYGAGGAAADSQEAQGFYGVVRRSIFISASNKSQYS